MTVPTAAQRTALALLALPWLCCPCLGAGPADGPQRPYNANVGPGDWPQLGGTPHRNNTPEGTDVPTDWDVETGRNIKWSVPLGSQTFGNTIVANGKVFVGTNNAAAYLKRYPADVDLGVLLCLRESDGQFLWQHSSAKLPQGRVHDWPLQGVCSAPVAEGDRLWFVTNRGEVVCLDAEGFHDGEDDGPATGVWSRTFETAANMDKLAGSLAKGSLPFEYRDTLRTVARQAGLDLPLFGIEVEPAGEPNEWFLTDNTTARNRRLRLTLDGPTLSMAGVGEDADKRAEVGLDLAAGLDDGRVSSGLRAHFVERGIDLPDDARPQALEAGKSWALAATAEGVPVEVRLDLADSVLVCRQKVTADLKTEADVVWSLDMMQDLGVRQHNMATCAPTVYSVPGSVGRW